MPGNEIDPGTLPIQLAKTTRGNVIRVALVAALGGLLYGYDTASSPAPSSRSAATSGSAPR